MGDKLKKLAQSVGLTKSFKRELSDIISEETEVINKSEEVQDLSFYPTHSNVYPHAALGGYYVNYFVKLKGSREFEVNDEFLFREVKVGDKVRVDYRNIDDVVSDYTGGDFSRKAEIERTRTGTYVEKAEKL